MKRLRQLHLYLGVFFAPLLLLFIGTGWYQTFDAGRLKSADDAETLVQKLRVVHTDQVYPFEGKPSRQVSPRGFKILVGAMSGGMVATTLIGLVLAAKAGRRLWPFWASLGLGTLVPIGLLWLAHR